MRVGYDISDLKLNLGSVCNANIEYGFNFWRFWIGLAYGSWNTGSEVYYCYKLEEGYYGRWCIC